MYFSSSSGNVSSRRDETNARDTYVSSFPRAPSTSDSVRLKCREMLAAALRTGGKFSAVRTPYHLHLHAGVLLVFLLRAPTA